MAVYGSWVESLVTTYFSGATFGAILVTSDYVQDHANGFRDDIADEVSGSGYTSGGVVLTGVSFTNTDGAVRMLCDLVDFGPIDVSDIAAIVFYVDTGSAATDVLITADVFDEPFDNTGGVLPVRYAPSSDGILVADFTQ